MQFTIVLVFGYGVIGLRFCKWVYRYIVNLLIQFLYTTTYLLYLSKEPFTIPSSVLKSSFMIMIVSWEYVSLTTMGSVKYPSMYLTAYYRFLLGFLWLAIIATSYYKVLKDCLYAC